MLCAALLTALRPPPQMHLKVYEMIFNETMPALYTHFVSEGVESEMYMLDWLLTLYSRSMPLNVAARIWDCYLLEGEMFVFKAALGFLRLISADLLLLQFDEILGAMSNTEVRCSSRYSKATRLLSNPSIDCNVSAHHCSSLQGDPSDSLCPPPPALFPFQDLDEHELFDNIRKIEITTNRKDAVKVITANNRCLGSIPSA